jgi:hypothetical protein
MRLVPMCTLKARLSAQKPKFSSQHLGISAKLDNGAGFRYEKMEYRTQKTGVRKAELREH